MARNISDAESSGDRACQMEPRSSPPFLIFRLMSFFSCNRLGKFVKYDEIISELLIPMGILEVEHGNRLGVALFAALGFSLGVLVTLGLKANSVTVQGWHAGSKSREGLNGAAKSSDSGDGIEAIRDGRVASSKLNTRASGGHSDLEFDLPLKRDIKDGIEGTIGNTPLVRIKSLSEATGCDILAKVEFLNGAGNSPKDRVALSIIENAEREGLLTPHSGDTIYEGTVGSTGISLATICKARGYSAHICMPSDQSVEKSSLLLKLGATVTRNTPVPIVDQSHYVNRARSLAASHSASSPGRGFFADQFETPYNHLAHLRTTGPEIYAQSGGVVDAFVAGAGTGGTISGVAMYLKPRLPSCKIVLADPQGSGLFNKVKYGVLFASTEREGTRRRHQVDSVVEGIGVNRVTQNFEQGRELVDDAIRVTDAQALRMARWLVEKDGIFVGSSSAVNCVAAVKTALELGTGKTVVTILCDSGMRHLSRFWKDNDTKDGFDVSKMTLEEVLAD